MRGHRTNKGRASRLLRAAGLVVATVLVAPAAVTAQAVAGAGQVEGANLTNEEKLERAAAEIEAMKEALRQALERLQDAREKKDIIQINCVNEKLSAIKGLLKIAEQAEVSLREAAVRKDEDLVLHEYTKISIAAARVENFRVEVEGCVGELSQYTGQTVVEASIDPEIRSDDPESAPDPAFDAIETTRPQPVTGSE